MEKTPENLFRTNLEDERDKNADSKQEVLPPVAEEAYIKEAQEFLDSYQRFFLTLAKDVSLRYKINPTAQTFFIDLEKGEINLSGKWFKEHGYSKEQMVWAVAHELGHFGDEAQDSQGAAKNIEHNYQKAKTIGALMMQKLEAKLGASDPEFIEKLKQTKPLSKKHPEKTMSQVDSIAYGYYHTFYNYLNDIYVNMNVARKAPFYEPGERGGDEVRKLYQDKLFTKKDYADNPRHLQFLAKLIREQMVTGEEVTVSPELAPVVNQKILFQGQEYTPQEIIEQFIIPRARWDTKMGQRNFVLEKTLEPIFEQLLLKDLEDWEPKKPEPQDPNSGEPSDGQSGGDPFADFYQEFKEHSPDQIDEDEMEEWADKFQKEKADKEAKQTQQENSEQKTSEQKAQEAQDQMDKQWSQEHNIQPETLRRFRQIEAEVAPYLEELSKLWQKIIFGYSRKIEREMEGHFQTGSELDIQKTIGEWPKIEEYQFDKTEVMKKMVAEEHLIQKPDLIRVRLVGDMSGSMNAEKIHILQQCFVLLLSSLREFNTYLNLTRTQTKSKLEADTEAWVFGDDALRVKRLRQESGMDEEQLEIVKIFEQLASTRGGTHDNIALEEIDKSITPEDRDKILQEKIMEIVFEITDGGSSAVSVARAAVDKLLQNGVIARAFQIGAVSDDEKNKFNEVWNKNREDKLGDIVGEKIENLLPVITELLKQYLGNVRL